MSLDSNLLFLEKNKKILFILNENDIKFNYNIFKSNFDRLCSLYDKFCVVYENESFLPETIETLKLLIDSKKNNEIYISHTSSMHDSYFLHPLLSLLFWEGTGMRLSISWNSSDRIDLFDKNHYNGDYTKEIPAIISVRKSTYTRDRIFSKLNNIKFNGIFRYAQWPVICENETEKNDYKLFPSFIELLDEYKKSYMSFVIETEKNSSINCMTEKTFIPFLTKTLPIFYNSSNYCKELNEMGFYTFNDLFGMDYLIDSLDIEDKSKINSFVDSVQYYNNLSNNQIESIYKNNIKKIEHNYNLAYKFLIELNYKWEDIAHTK